MEFNILILPLIGGYYFLSESYYFKFKYDRISDQRLIFSSAIAGFVFLIPAFISNIVLEALNGDCTVKPFASYFGLDMSYLGTSILSFLYAFLGVKVPNKLIDNREKREEKSNRKNRVKKSIKKYGELLEIVLLDAFEEDKMVSITLKSNKVYVGWSIYIDEPDQNKKEYIQVVPTFSGYRDTDTKELYLTTEYPLIDSDPQRTNKDFIITIRRDEVVSINFFDIQLYDKFN
ncbi:MAG: hypothetical protein GDA51_05740 [Ekhidna sp.]|nr:hypothetical protein [Ekhidna sp.]MBC6425962.1 hypothetical protein [Ekhidna sp.]